MMKKKEKFISSCHVDLPPSRHVERSETSRDTTTEFGSQGPHGGKAPSGRRERGESGRSMVEILGVLAIMGVLSIGGISGYQYAMNRYRANEIVNGVKMRAFEASQQRMRGQTIDLKEFYPEQEFDTILSFEVEPDETYHGDPGLFSLFVYDVPEGTCNAVLNLDWQLPTEIDVNGVAVVPETVCDEGLNEMTFAFGTVTGAALGCDLNEELVEGSCCPVVRVCTDTNGDKFCCGSGRRCDNGICIGTCSGNKTWHLTAEKCCAEPEQDVANCITKAVDATKGVCPRYDSACDADNEYCDEGNCCENGTSYDEVAKQCCDAVSPNASGCVTELVAATDGFCAYYRYACDADNEYCDEGNCCENGTSYDEVAEQCCEAVSPNVGGCVTELVPATAGFCSYYRYACDADTEYCDAGNCCENNTFWNADAKTCCPDVQPDENACLTELVAATEGNCPTYTDACVIRTDGKTVCDGAGNCVECLADADCANRTDGKTMCDTAKHTCVSPLNMTCDDNTICNGGKQTGEYFCNFGHGLTKPAKGTCTNIGQIQRGTNTGWVANNFFISWWGAENWCRAIGSSGMVSSLDFGCANGLGQEGANFEGYCYNPSNTSQYSQTMLLYIEDFGERTGRGRYYWTETSADSSNPDYRFGVGYLGSVGVGRIYNSFQRSSGVFYDSYLKGYEGYYALCK